HPNGRSNRLPSARLAEPSGFHPLLARERQTGDHIDREGTFLLETPRCRRGTALRAGRTLGRACWNRPPLRSSETEIRSKETPGVARQEARLGQTYPGGFGRVDIRRVRRRQPSG